MALLGDAARTARSEAVVEGLTVADGCVVWSRPGLAVTPEVLAALRGAAARLKGSPGVALAMPDAIRALQARVPAGRGGGVSVAEGADRLGGLSQTDAPEEGPLPSPKSSKRGRQIVCARRG